MTPVLTCRGLDAGWSGRAVVRGFDLELHAGEVVALLGPNGAGKTTVLSTLAGLIPRVAGTVELGGEPLPNGNAVAVGRKGLVLVPDDRSLFKTLTARENLTIARGKGGGDIEDVLADLPALRERLGVDVGLLSGGEQQMVAVGRALIRRPRVLLVDELSTGLAPMVVNRLLGVVREAASASGMAVVLVEQHAELALATADRAVVLVHGETVLAGDASDLSTEVLRQAYLGERPSGVGRPG